MHTLDWIIAVLTFRQWRVANRLLRAFSDTVKLHPGPVSWMLIEITCGVLATQGYATTISRRALRAIMVDLAVAPYSSYHALPRKGPWRRAYNLLEFRRRRASLEFHSGAPIALYAHKFIGLRIPGVYTTWGT